MWNDYIFEILEIEPTYDAKKIKKAYANLVKKYHPEEHPEKWKKIHDAYETALSLARKEEYLDGRVEMPKPVMKIGETEIPPRSTQENPPEPVIKSGRTEIPPRSSQENPPKPVTKSGRVEIPLKSSEESDEMYALFDNIEELSREKKNQKKEERKKAVEEAIATLRQMAAKKRLNQKEWETFFGREDMQSIICTGEFLYELGECFINKKINTGMYHFLLEQLDRIEQYRKDRNITEDSAGVSDPLGYARGKICSACKAQGRMHDLVGGAHTFVKAATWLLVVLLSSSGLYLRIARYTGGTAQQRQKQYEQSVEKANRDREIIEEMQLIEEQQNKIKEELSQSIELIGMGDTREKMISLYGEPDIIQEDSENPNYEKAVYHLYDTDMTITLYMDVVMNVHYETK